MYLDKLYTKLYSTKDWDGLNQLINEIKVFARRDYEGLNSQAQDYLKSMRSQLASQLMAARRRANQPIPEGPGGYVTRTWTTGGSRRAGRTITTSPIEYHSEQVMTPAMATTQEKVANQKFLDNAYYNELPEIKGKLRKMAEQYHNYNTIHPDYVAGKTKKWWTARLDDDTNALQAAISKNQDNLVGDKSIMKPSEGWDGTHLDGSFVTDMNGKRYFKPSKLELRVSENTPEARYKKNETMKSRPFKGHLDPDYDEVY